MSAGTSAPWWRDAVVYQVYVRSFADSDGDGLGDLPGIRSRLPYLRDLGVDAVWLNPFYPSPMHDAGYDVSDYCDVDPRFGTLGDFDGLLADAHDLGLKVIVDIVPNHSSDAHPWFQAALAAGPGSRERARYVFRPGKGPDEPPSGWPSVFGGPAWKQVPDGEWFLHLFAPEQPDFDWAHPDVAELFLGVLRFWLDRGVDGFRIDVAHGMVKELEEPLIELEASLKLSHMPDETGEHPLWDRPGVHDIYRSWNALLRGYDGDRMMVGEAWVASPERRAGYVRADELSQAFNFDFLESAWDATSLRAAVESELATVGGVGATPTWVLANHDVEREVTRYGGGPGGTRRARAAALLMLALPGSAYVYQGQELGLPEVSDLPDEVLQDPTFLRTNGEIRGRDGCRVPIPWSGNAPPYGFGPREGQPWLPQPATWAALSVEAETGDAASMLELYRAALAARRDVTGDLAWIADAPERTVAFRRGDGFACVVNVSDEPTPISWPGQVVLASDSALVAGTDATDGIELPPDTAVWLSHPA